MRFIDLSDFFYYTAISYPLVLGKSQNSSVITKMADSRIIRTLDGYSYYVFLVHGVFCMGFFNLYEKLPLPLATVLFVIATILSAVVLKLISQAISRPLLKMISKK